MALVRDQFFKMRLTSAEKDMLNQIAETSGITASDWIRLAIRQASVSITSVAAQSKNRKHGHPSHGKR